jgi:hypothetical protein
MTDLLYDCQQYTNELKTIFPDCNIEDASDDIHEGRIKITVDIDEWEYWRKIFLEGFSDLSIKFQLKKYEKEFTTELLKRFKIWEKEYPEYFKKDKK